MTKILYWYISVIQTYEHTNINCSYMFIYVTYIYDEMDVLGLCADLTERISFCLLTVYPFLKLLHKI